MSQALRLSDKAARLGLGTLGATALIGPTTRDILLSIVGRLLGLNEVNFNFNEL